jgi:hypothetical protein
MSEIYGTIWVCVCCLFHDANGECGDCHSEHGHDEEPLSAIGDGYSVTSGMGWEDHSDDCLQHIIHDLKERFPDVDWPDVPGDYECECETDTFSRSQCDGCGSYLHGERHGMTLWKEDERPAVESAPESEPEFDVQAWRAQNSCGHCGLPGGH